MKYLNGQRIKRVLTDRGFCHVVKLRDFAPDKMAFECHVYESDENYLELEVLVNGIVQHTLKSYLTLLETLRYADRTIEQIIEQRLEPRTQ